MVRKLSIKSSNLLASLSSDKWDYWLLLAIFLLSFVQLPLLLRVSPTIVRSDGVGYYAYLRSFFFDHDFDFRNEYTYFAAVLPQTSQPMSTSFLTGPTTYTDLVHNHWSIGPAVLWSLPFLAGHASAWVLNSLGYNVPLDGYSYPYQIAIAVGSALYAFVGLILVYEISKQYFPKRVCLLALLAVWFSTSLTAYMYFMPAMSHASSFFAVSLFLFVWYRTKGARSLAMWVVLGLTVGLMILQRLENSLFTLAVAFECLPLFLEQIKAGRWKKLLELGVALLVFAFCTVVAFLPQMIAWRVLYGRFLLNVRGEHLAAVFDWTRPRITSVLFSSNHGLISWTPIVAFGLVGLSFLANRNKLLACVLMVVFLLRLYVISCWPYWYQGAAFGGRMFISCTPAFVLGLAALMDWLRRHIPLRVPIVVGALLVAWNYLLLFQYGTGMIPRQGYISWSEVFHNSMIAIPAAIIQKAQVVLISHPLLMLFLSVIALLALSLGWLARRHWLIRSWE